jgi:hypothetical protein
MVPVFAKEQQHAVKLSRLKMGAYNALFDIGGTIGPIVAGLVLGALGLSRFLLHHRKQQKSGGSIAMFRKKAIIFRYKALLYIKWVKARTTSEIRRQHTALRLW